MGYRLGKNCGNCGLKKTVNIKKVSSGYLASKWNLPHIK
jgi:hypothetical protein